MSRTNQKRVGVLGARGLAGQELSLLLMRHPSLELAHCWSVRKESQGQENPVSGAPPIEGWNAGAGVDAVFLATPHGKSAALAAEALDQGALVIDLSGDLRIRNQVLWEQTYAQAHPCPGLLDMAIYGLTEINREQIQNAQLIANPGCYPTSILLGTQPLQAAGLLQEGAAVISDSKSGVSGAGVAANATTHYAAVHENFRAYGVGDHRHGPEIQEHLGGPEVIFVPHLLPCYRGILSTMYVQLVEGAGAPEAHQALAQKYEHEPFVQVLDPGQQPTLRGVQNTNQCHLGIAQAGSQVVITSVIDNLQKGAAGQAVQNLNLMLGLPETEGLS